MKRHDIVEKLEWKKIHFTLKTWSNGKVFWAIGEKDVLLLLKKDFHIELSKKHIVLPSGHIKALWESFIYIKLWKDAMAKMTVCIVAEQ